MFPTSMEKYKLLFVILFYHMPSDIAFIFSLLNWTALLQLELNLIHFVLFLIQPQGTAMQIWKCNGIYNKAKTSIKTIVATNFMYKGKKWICESCLSWFETQDWIFIISMNKWLTLE